MSDVADDRIAALARLYLGGRHPELYDAAVSLVGALAVAESRGEASKFERPSDLGGFWERAPVWARAMELALRGESTGLSEFLSRAPDSTGYIERRRRDVKLCLRDMMALRGSGEIHLRSAAELRSLAALAQAGAGAREELVARVALAHALSLWVLNAEAEGVDLTPHADCLFPDDYIPSPEVDVKEPVAVRAVFTPGYVDGLRTSLTLVQEKLLTTQKELQESQAALKDALQAQVDASKADKPPTYDVRFGLPLPADCEAHSGPECGWLVTWYEGEVRKTAILHAQWDRERWARKMGTWVPLRDGLPCTWPVGGAPPQPYHVQHREEMRRLQDLARDAEKRVDIWRDAAEGRKNGQEALEKQTQQLLKRIAERDEVIGKLQAQLRDSRSEGRALRFHQGCPPQTVLDYHTNVNDGLWLVIPEAGGSCWLRTCSENYATGGETGTATWIPVLKHSGRYIPVAIPLPDMTVPL